MLFSYYFGMILLITTAAARDGKNRAEEQDRN
jgi:hypothetical protein